MTLLFSEKNKHNNMQSEIFNVEQGEKMKNHTAQDDEAMATAVTTTEKTVLPAYTAITVMAVAVAVVVVVASVAEW